MRQITLTKGMFALVDDEDFEYLNQWKWHATKKASNWYAQRWLGKKSILMQNTIFNGTIKIDHIDGNGLNNQKYNLREVTDSQNSQNRIKRKDSSSPFKGVCRRKEKWQAYIKIEKKWKHLGLFTTPEEAALAYDQAAKQYFGEFAKLNIIEV